MEKKSGDFKGIVALDKTLAPSLDAYLIEKERQMTERLDKVLSKATCHESFSLKSFDELYNEAIQLDLSAVQKKQWQSLRDNINVILWEYVDVIDGCLREFAKQVKQSDFQKWNDEIFQTVQHIYKVLKKHIARALYILGQAEEMLWCMHESIEASKYSFVLFRYFRKLFASLLDRSLWTYAKKSANDLKKVYERFTTRFRAYFRIQSAIDQSLPKFYSYPYFAQADKELQDKYLYLFSLLKLWQQNQKLRLLNDEDISRVIRRETNFEEVTELFSSYKEQLNLALFDTARNLKVTTYDKSETKVLLDVLKLYGLETKRLLAIVAKYRDFYLCTHPNPYVRTRWGFAEWLTGPEPFETTQLKDLIFELDSIEENFENLQKSLIREKNNTEHELQILNEVLIDLRKSKHSLEAVRNREERFLVAIERLDELGANSMDIVYEVDFCFYRALRLDWPFLSLFNFPKFHKLYAIHIALMGESDNKIYLERMKELKRLIVSIKNKIRQKETSTYFQELEKDKKIIAEQLKDFIKEIENKASNDLRITIHHAMQLRYIFGQFFYYLGRADIDSEWIRSQFLFVDQLLDTIDRKIALLKP